MIHLWIEQISLARGGWGRNAQRHVGTPPRAKCNHAWENFHFEKFKFEQFKLFKVELQLPFFWLLAAKAISPIALGTEVWDNRLRHSFTDPIFLSFRATGKDSAKEETAIIGEQSPTHSQSPSTTNLLCSPFEVWVPSHLTPEQFRKLMDEHLYPRYWWVTIWEWFCQQITMKRSYCLLFKWQQWVYSNESSDFYARIL